MIKRNCTIVLAKPVTSPKDGYDYLTPKLANKLGNFLLSAFFAYHNEYYAIAR